MKEYHVYGIGNAILDFEFEVADATLSKCGLVKGTTDLIDAGRELALLEELEGIKHQKACGGSCANTMITLKNLGSKGFYSCKVANDAAGDFFYEDLLQTGLHTNLTADGRPDGTTGKCIVTITPDAERTMSTYVGITDSFSCEELRENVVKKAKYIFLEGYQVASTTALQAMLKAKTWAKAHGTKVAITLSDQNMVKFFRQQFETVLAEPVDLLFCNEDEALLFCETDDLAIAAERLKAVAKTFLITRADKDTLLFDGERFETVSTYKADVISTLGAGDTFAGAFLHAINHQFNFKQAADIANYASSLVISKFGPRLEAPHYQQVRDKINTLTSTQVTTA